MRNFDSDAEMGELECSGYPCVIIWWVVQAKPSGDEPPSGHGRFCCVRLSDGRKPRLACSHIHFLFGTSSDLRHGSNLQTTDYHQDTQPNCFAVDLLYGTARPCNQWFALCVATVDHGSMDIAQNHTLIQSGGVTTSFRIQNLGGFDTVINNLHAHGKLLNDASLFAW